MSPCIPNGLLRNRLFNCEENSCVLNAIFWCPIKPVNCNFPNEKSFVIHSEKNGKVVNLSEGLRNSSKMLLRQKFEMCPFEMLQYEILCKCISPSNWTMSKLYEILTKHKNDIYNQCHTHMCIATREYVSAVTNNSKAPGDKSTRENIIGYSERTVLWTLEKPRRLRLLMII